MTDDDFFELTHEEEEFFVECGRLMLSQLHERAMRRLGGGPFDGVEPFPA